MTLAEARREIESHLRLAGLDQHPRVAEALAALAPKPRKAASKVHPAAKLCERKPFFGNAFGRGPEAIQTGLYLDTFGPKGSPEREAAELRMRAEQNGPQAEEYGCPERDNGTSYSDWFPTMVAWKLTSDGQAYEDARVRWEGRREQFQWEGLPKKVADSTAGQLIAQFVARTCPEAVNAVELVAA
jgi:hypothetical protein